ncbi:MAG: response regulator [Lentisphaeraceae bacterium]|nr:response regulator [Lentisphaeraceae bacterium]
MNQSTFDKIKLILEDNKDCKGKVLIVDNQATYRSSYSRILESSGFETASADCGFKAIEVLTFFRADIVILDCSLNRLENLTCSKYIQQIDPNISIIFTSTDMPSELKILTFKAGGKELIEKASNGKIIKELVEKHICTK